MPISPKPTVNTSAMINVMIAVEGMKLEGNCIMLDTTNQEAMLPATRAKQAVDIPSKVYS